MEIPGSVSTSTSSAISSQPINNTNNTNSNQSEARQVESNSDDPLAAIMNQTIFGGGWCFDWHSPCSKFQFVFSRRQHEHHVHTGQHQQFPLCSELKHIQQQWKCWERHQQGWKGRRGRGSRWWSWSWGYSYHSRWWWSEYLLQLWYLQQACQGKSYATGKLSLSTLLVPL